MIYLDTSCLLKLYYPEPESAAVAAHVAGQSILFTAIHELEIKNALELKVHRKEATSAQVKQVVRLLDDDLGAGVLHRCALDWESILHEAAEISAAHTRQVGTRSLDILHCAAALALVSESFITTDHRQWRLAKKLGLNCPKV